MSAVLIIALSAGSFLLLNTSLAPLSFFGILAVIYLVKRDKHSIDNFYAACFTLTLVGGVITILQMLSG